MKVIAILCLLMLIVSGTVSRDWIVVDTSNKDFNDIMKRFNDRMILRIEGEGEERSFSVIGGCNVCSFSSSSLVCRCTKRMCFRETPSEMFMCEVSAQRTVMRDLMSISEDTYTATTPMDKSNQASWIKYSVMKSDV